MFRTAQIVELWELDVEFPYENDVLQAKVAENDFAIMTAGNLAGRCNRYGCKGWDESTVPLQMWLPFDSWSRDSNKRMNPAFWTHRNSNEDVVFEIFFSSEFEDRFCRGDVRCVVTTVIVKSGMYKLEIWHVIQNESLIREFFVKATALCFYGNNLFFCSFWYYPLLVIFDVILLCDCLV